MFWRSLWQYCSFSNTAVLLFCVLETHGAVSNTKIPRVHVRISAFLVDLKYYDGSFLHCQPFKIKIKGFRFE